MKRDSAQGGTSLAGGALMRTPTLRSLVFAILATGILSSAACYVEEEVPAPAYSDGYQPQFYDGYVVYYDQAGRPFYYSNGAVYWVPVTSPVYVGLVNHWHVYGPAYGRWYGNRGFGYRGYRSSVRVR
jgi:hypothetical protein